MDTRYSQDSRSAIRADARSVARLLELVGRALEGEGTEPIAVEAAGRYLTVKDYAQRCSLSCATVRRRLKDGMPHRRFGRAYRIDVADADAWFERQRPSRRGAAE